MGQKKPKPTDFENVIPAPDSKIAKAATEISLNPSEHESSPTIFTEDDFEIEQTNKSPNHAGKKLKASAIDSYQESDSLPSNSKKNKENQINYKTIKN